MNYLKGTTDIANLRQDIQADLRNGIDASSVQSKYDSLLKLFEEHVGTYLHYLAANPSDDNRQRIRTICTDFSNRNNVLNYEINGETPSDVAMKSGFPSAVTLLNKSRGADLNIKPILKQTEEPDRHGHVTPEDQEGIKNFQEDMRKQYLLEYYRMFGADHERKPTQTEMKKSMKEFSPNPLLRNTAANTGNLSRYNRLRVSKTNDSTPTFTESNRSVTFAQDGGSRKKKARKTRKMRKARRGSR